MKDYDLAEKDFLIALEKDPENPLYLLNAALNYHEMK